MSNYGVSTQWHDIERKAQDDVAWRVRHGVSAYSLECQWWKHHLAYCVSLPGFTASAWLDVVDGWLESTARLGETEAIFEVARLRAALA